MGQYQARIAALILGIVLILIGLIVSAILDSQAAAQGDSDYRCTLKANAAPYAIGDTIILNGGRACSEGVPTTSGDDAEEAIRDSKTISDAQDAALNTAIRAADASRAPITSFAGAKPMNDLLPMLLRVVLVLIGVALISVGGAGMMGYGRLAGR